jgi:succinate dehydrogenase hydrophobic anchor subunit
MTMRDQTLWFWHVTAGVVILVLLTVHMVTMHMDEIIPISGLNPAGGHPIDWENVVARGKSVANMVGYVILLGAGLFHGLYGFRNILFEMIASTGKRTAASWILILIGVAVFVIGVYGAWGGYVESLSATAG